MKVRTSPTPLRRVVEFFEVYRLYRHSRSALLI